MDFVTQLQSEINQALKNKEELKLQTLRMLSSALHNEEIAKGNKLSDVDIQVVIKREVKKRREAYDSFKTAERNEAAQKEEQEMKILEVYLPEMMDETEIIKIIDEEINNHPETSAGQIIGLVIKRTKGQADGGVVAQLVNKRLA